jgi:hypothetical protein
MKDKEFIKLEQKRMPYIKQIYNLRVTDFIPIVGLNNHTKRCLDEMNNNPFSHATEDYASQSWARDCVLIVYNISLGIGVVSGLAGLISLISK